MTLEYILSKAGCRPAHCFSAHVPGKGYVNDGSDPTIAEDYRRARDRALKSEIENIGFAGGYAEPGYQDPAKGVLFANWNVFPRGFDSILERAGYAIEWSDEWSTCDQCGKAVRTSPDSYSWTRSYWLANECEIVCRECLDPAEYLESLENDPATCNTFDDIDPADYGYVRHNGIFESGFHPGQTDDPRTVYAQLRKTYTRVLFSIESVGQFDARWTAWIREDGEDGED